MKKLILLALTLYTLLGALTFHPDTKLTLYYPTLNNGKVWDIYTYLHNNKDDAPPFHYPPMHFLALKAELPIVKIVGGDGIEKWFKVGGGRAVMDQKIYLYNLASKLPIMILVILTGMVIYKILSEQNYKENRKMAAVALWFFNPITLYSAVMMGQNDMLAIFPFMLGLMFFYKKPITAFVLFGLAASIKNYPLIWSLVLAFSYPKVGIKNKIGLAMIPVVIYVSTMLPFIGKPYFLSEVVYSGLAVRMFESKLDIGFGDQVLVVPMLLAIVLLFGQLAKGATKIKRLALIMIATNLSILGFSHFHPQWFIWVVPFLSIYLSKINERAVFIWTWLVMTMVGVVFLFSDKFLYWGVFSPVNPGLLNLPFMREILISRGIDVVLLNNLLHSAIAAMAIYFIYKVSRYEK